MSDQGARDESHGGGLHEPDLGMGQIELLQDPMYRGLQLSSANGAQFP
jgi:hypothetical protein